jgi:hypothetical protein
LQLASPERARELDAALRKRQPAVYLEPGEIDHGRLLVSPLCLRPEDAALITTALAETWHEVTE